MKVVSAFEYRLLRLLRAFLQAEPVEQVRPQVVEAFPQPPCLTRPAVELVQDTLAKGCVQLLARQGGWRRERHLRGGRVAEGRLWERTPPAELGLKFSRHTLDFLVWITATSPEKGKTSWQPPEPGLTLGDRLLVYFAFDALVQLRFDWLEKALTASSAFHRNALCRLAYPRQFGAVPEDAQADFAPWTAGPGAAILEALQGRLAERCVLVEAYKGTIESWQDMQAVGRAQERVLEGFLQAAERAGRMDLARFLLETAAAVLIEDVKAERWTGKLTNAGPRLADRADTYRAALALLHQLPRLREWARKARSVGYFDEGYPASQLWLADWERCQGDLLCTRAEAVIRQLDPMKQTASPASPSPGGGERKARGQA